MRLFGPSWSVSSYMHLHAPLKPVITRDEPEINKMAKVGDERNSTSGTSTSSENTPVVIPTTAMVVNFILE